MMVFLLTVLKDMASDDQRRLHHRVNSSKHEASRTQCAFSNLTYAACNVSMKLIQSKQGSLNTPNKKSLH